MRYCLRSSVKYKATRHIDIRYFFVKDRVESGEVHIEHCPTLDMLADYFTKPLQGALLYKLRDLIMNIDPNMQQNIPRTLAAGEVPYSFGRCDQRVSVSVLLKTRCRIFLFIHSRKLHRKLVGSQVESYTRC